MIKLEFVIERKEREKSVVLCFEIKTFKYFTFCSVSRPHLHSQREWNKTKEWATVYAFLSFIPVCFESQLLRITSFWLLSNKKVGFIFHNDFAEPKLYFSFIKNFIIRCLGKMGIRSKSVKWFYIRRGKVRENAVALAQNSKTHSVK